MPKRHQPESRGHSHGSQRHSQGGAEDDGFSEDEHTMGGYVSLTSPSSVGGATIRSEQTIAKVPLPDSGTTAHGIRTRAPAYSKLMKCAAVGDTKGVQALLDDIAKARRAPNRATEEASSPGIAASSSSAWGAREPVRRYFDDGRLSTAETTTAPVIAEDLFGQDRKGRTALDWARLGRHFACAELLQTAMTVNIDRRRAQAERNAEKARLQGMVARNRRARINLLEAMELHKADEMHLLLDVSLEPRDSVPPLTRAAFQKAAQLLLPSKADRRREKFWLDAESSVNGSPLVVACTCGDLPLVQKLLHPSHQCKLDHETSRGHTALTWACVCGQLEAVAALLDEGASLTFAVRKTGRTALHMAAAALCAPVVQLLLDRAYRRAVDTRHEAATVGLRSEAEQRGTERAWLHSFAQFCHAKDHTNLTALEVAQHHAEELQLGEQCEAVSILQAAETRLALRSWQLEQQDKAAAPTLCVQGCGHSDRADAIEHHEINLCPKRMVGCELCGQQLPLDQVNAHDQVQCPNRRLLCCMIGRGCREAIKAENLELHEKRLCKYRDVLCRVPCDAVLQFRHRDDHEQNACPNRSLSCTLSCGAMVRAVDMKAHREHDCPMRKVNCRVSCGRCDLPYGEREAHEQEECIQPCCWEGCVDRIGPLKVRQVHETFLCPRRPVACPLGCGATGLCAAILDAHTSNLCARRPLPCPLGCGATLLARELEAHCDQDTGDCPERLLRCPLDCVRVNGREGRRIEVETSPGNYIYCSLRAYNRVENAFKLLYPGTVRWERLANLSYKVVDDHGWACGWVPADAMNRHIDSECHLRVEPCPAHCGQILFVGKMEVHLAACPRKIQPCPLECGMHMEARFLEDHVAEECECRDIPCPKCGNRGVTERIMRQHWREDCTMLEVRCGYGCGASVARKHLDHHMATQCGKRPAQCSDCGRTDELWFEELEQHKAEDCPKRTVLCSLGCEESMQEDFRLCHETTLCVRRNEACENCGMVVMQKDLADHKVNDCPGFLRACPTGCGVKVRTSDLAKHMSDDCARRHSVGSSGSIPCPLACGKDLTYLEQFKHVTSECPRRIVDCPTGCKEMVALNLLEEHQAVCMRRVLLCGSNSPPCARQLASWLIPSAELRRGKLAREAVELEKRVKEQALLALQAHRKERLALELERPPLLAAKVHHEAQRDALILERNKVADQQRSLDEWCLAEGNSALVLEQVVCSLHGSTALIRCCATGDNSCAADLINRLRRSGLSRAQVTAELDRAATSDGHTALTKACAVNDLTMVELLVREGASVDFETPNGRTPLVECAKHGSVEPLRFLMECGAKLNLVTKQKATAFDWALNSGQSRALRHLVREYRVQKDIERLYRLIMKGDLKAIREVIKEGEPYVLNHQQTIESEIGEIDEEEEECEATVRALALDLNEKEQHLGRCLAAEARELEKVKALQDEMASHENDGDAIVASMLEQYDNAMLFLQSLEPTDLTEITDVSDSKYAPPAARRIVKGMCVMLGLEPLVKHDERIQRYRYKYPAKKAQMAMKKKDKKKKVVARRDVYQRRGARRDSGTRRDDNDESSDGDKGIKDSYGDDDVDNEEGALRTEGDNQGGEKEEGDASHGDDLGTSVDWWAAGLSFLSRKNCLAELRYFNKTSMTSDRLHELFAIAGPKGRGLKWGPRERAGGDDDDDEMVLGGSSSGSGGGGGNSSRLGSDAGGQQQQQLVRHNRVRRPSSRSQRSDLDTERSSRNGRGGRGGGSGGRLTPVGSDDDEEEENNNDLGHFVGDDVTDSASAVSPLDGASVDPPMIDTVDPIGNSNNTYSSSNGENNDPVGVVDPISNNSKYSSSVDNGGDDFSFVSGVSGGGSGNNEQRAPSPWDGTAGEGTEFLDPISGQSSTGSGGFLAFLGDGSDDSSGSATTAPPLQIYSNKNANGSTGAGEGSPFGVGLLDFTKGTLSGNPDSRNHSGRNSSRREGNLAGNENVNAVVSSGGSGRKSCSRLLSNQSRLQDANKGGEFEVNEGGEYEEDEWKYEGLGNEDPDRPWKGVEALAKWLTAVLAYHEASEVHNSLKERELADRERYDASLPALEKAQYHVRIAKFGTSLVRRELEETKRHALYLSKKSKGAEERLRVAKIFQIVASSGHTLVSWAAAVNQPDVLELLFDYGGPPGCMDTVHTLSATIVQLTFRNWWWRGHRGPYSATVAAEWRNIELTFQLSLSQAVDKLRGFRAKNRVPLVEALYNGHVKPLEVYLRKKLPLFAAARSTVAPLAVCPFVTPPPGRAKAVKRKLELARNRYVGNTDKPTESNDDEHQDSSEASSSSAGEVGEVVGVAPMPPRNPTSRQRLISMDMLSAALHGCAERGQCDEYVRNHGWIPWRHEASRWTLAVDGARAVWVRIAKTMADGVEEKARKRRMRLARAELARNEAKMDVLLTAGKIDWPGILKLMEEGVASDYESHEGFTPLLRAAEEDTEGLSYAPCVNDDGKQVLAVELLLDRQKSRPKLDAENRHGHTALSWAAIKDRLAQMDALVQRGATVQRPSLKHQRSALLWAVIKGKQRSVRFLLESGSDADHKDFTGKNAYDWAKQQNHAETVAVLLQFKQGNMGLTVARRGAAISKVPCCWGCGLLADVAFLSAGHEANDCPKRYVKCRNPGCTVELLQAWEQPRHESELCPLRPVDCPLGCGGRMPRSGTFAHVDAACPLRTVTCSLNCGASVRARDVEIHLQDDCPHRVVDCPLMCHGDVRARDLRDHTKNLCPARIVGCRVGCGLTLMARLRSGHEEEHCDFRVVACQNNCKVEDLKQKDLENHERHACPRRIVVCPNKCTLQRLQARAVPTHLSSNCRRRFVSCPEQCGRSVRFESLPSHLSHECQRREIPCPLGCGVEKLQARHVEVHCRSECPRRVVVCSLCGEGVPWADVKKHKDDHCALREVECTHRGCSKQLPLAELKKHMQFDCRKRLVYCLQGCGFTLTADKRKGHQARDCPLRFVGCPLGCDRLVREIEKTEHVEKLCVRRTGGN